MPEANVRGDDTGDPEPTQDVTSRRQKRDATFHVKQNSLRDMANLG